MDAQGIALVTGASRGLGRAVAVALARAGFDVVAAMRHPAAGAGLADEVGGGAGRVSVVELDVTRPETIAIPEGLRVLVNNAGIERDYLPVEAVPMAQWREVFETNVFGAVETTRRAIPVMRSAGGGVICNVTSSSLVVSVPFYSVYRASKAALEALGESLRAEVAPLGIRVIEVLPGPIDTHMLASSSRLPEAASCPGYETMARAWHQGRAGAEPFVTSPEQAATSICRAILDDGGPLRWACGPLGEQLLAAWQGDPESTLNAR